MTILYILIFYSLTSSNFRLIRSVYTSYTYKNSLQYISFFKKQPYAFFKPIDLSHYSVHKSIKVQLPKK